MVLPIVAGVVAVPLALFLHLEQKEEERRWELSGPFPGHCAHLLNLGNPQDNGTSGPVLSATLRSLSVPCRAIAGLGHATSPFSPVVVLRYGSTLRCIALPSTATAVPDYSLQAHNSFAAIPINQAVSLPLLPSNSPNSLNPSTRNVSSLNPHYLNPTSLNPRSLNPSAPNSSASNPSSGNVVTLSPDGAFDQSSLEQSSQPQDLQQIFTNSQQQQRSQQTLQRPFQKLEVFIYGRSVNRHGKKCCGNRQQSQQHCAHSRLLASGCTTFPTLNPGAPTQLAEVVMMDRKRRVLGRVMIALDAIGGIIAPSAPPAPAEVTGSKGEGSGKEEVDEEDEAVNDRNPIVVCFAGEGYEEASIAVPEAAFAGSERTNDST
eukprot:TRINITY_DN12838_c0_g1_i1.p1 TRINITY_DN12838_c0_g1~~TRINITY_DN12838_c0_g1_i1.p1  ORF type:complete len:375 (-),score=46.98 TRINITY_DN12838_c0_g1_i1:1075-2199(-)